MRFLIKLGLIVLLSIIPSQRLFGLSLEEMEVIDIAGLKSFNPARDDFKCIITSSKGDIIVYTSSGDKVKALVIDSDSKTHTYDLGTKKTSSHSLHSYWIDNDSNRLVLLWQKGKEFSLQINSLDKFELIENRKLKLPKCLDCIAVISDNHEYFLYTTLIHHPNPKVKLGAFSAKYDPEIAFQRAINFGTMLDKYFLYDKNFNLIQSGDFNKEYLYNSVLNSSIRTVRDFTRNDIVNVDNNGNIMVVTNGTYRRATDQEIIGPNIGIEYISNGKSYGKLFERALGDKALCASDINLSFNNDSSISIYGVYAKRHFYENKNTALVRDALFACSGRFRIDINSFTDITNAVITAPSEYRNTLASFEAEDLTKGNGTVDFNFKPINGGYLVTNYEPYNRHFGHSFLDYNFNRLWTEWEYADVKPYSPYYIETAEIYNTEDALANLYVLAKDTEPDGEGKYYSNLIKRSLFNDGSYSSEEIKIPHVWLYRKGIFLHDCMPELIISDKYLYCAYEDVIYRFPIGCEHDGNVLYDLLKQLS